jgi:3',5'-cyclic AMP phosphodiesterase CpdA
MLIVQITDTHIMRRGERLAGRLDSSERLACVVRAVARLDTRPDCVLLTGDLTDRGAPEAYAILRATLAPLALPVYAVPGNHDDREHMRAAFADCPWMPQAAGSRLNYEVDLGRFILLALDSLVPRADYGMLGAEQLEWLAGRLAAAQARRVLVMVHHPPISSGVAIMDAMKLRDAAAFGDLLRRHPNVERVLCGHMHRSMHARWCGTVVSIPSATVEQIHLGFQPDAPLGTITEPPGFQLHYDDPTDGLVTHAVPVGDFAGPYVCG